MLKLFGIPNCAQVKKSQKWLMDQNIDCEFHDYKKQGITKKQLADWYKFADWETLLNKRSRTWKELSETDRSDLNQTKAISLMQQHPTLIKRPIVQNGNAIEVGFDNIVFTQKFN